RALLCKKLSDPFVARDVAFATKHAPIYGQRRKTKRAAVMSERIEERVCGTVITLRRVAEDRRHRREHNKAIERHITCSLMKPPCTQCFRTDDAGHSFPGQRSQRCVIDDHRKMKNTAQRLAKRTDFFEQPVDVLLGTGIGFDDLNSRSMVAKLLHESFSLGRVRAVAT